jgi:two-component system OmpR family response regulator
MARPVIALICLSQDPDDSLADYLERRGYEVREADEEWMAESLLSGGGVEVAVIGEKYPASQGFDLLRRYAGEAGPSFVMISGRADLIEKVLALELGAADIVAAPVVWRELAARIGGIVGRRGKSQRELIVLENATVDLKAALVMHRSGSEEQLSPGQVALLRRPPKAPRPSTGRSIPASCASGASSTRKASRRSAAPAIASIHPARGRAEAWQASTWLTHFCVRRRGVHGEDRVDLDAVLDHDQRDRGEAEQALRIKQRRQHGRCEFRAFPVHGGIPYSVVSDAKRAAPHRGARSS